MSWSWDVSYVSVGPPAIGANFDRFFFGGVPPLKWTTEKVGSLILTSLLEDPVSIFYCLQKEPFRTQEFGKDMVDEEWLRYV